MTLAILCSGQGRQHPQMFALTGDAPASQDLFAHAARLLAGEDPREMVRTAPVELLLHNRTGQILCSLQALAAAAALRSVFPTPLVVAGYSIGEVAAWGVAGLFDLRQTLDLVARRAEIMDAVSPRGDGLLFVRGLRRPVIENLCARHDAAIAIVNPGNAFVLGGNRAALDALGAQARAMKASRVVDVAVDVASHTRRLAGASPLFREELRAMTLHAPLLPVTRLLTGIDAGPVLDVESGLGKLAAQISQTVQWAACLEACVEAGATAFLELGPGPALSEMAAGAYPGIPARSLDDFKTLDGVRAWLERYAGA
jgi:[acyl-carrier-protein] S-malonyltransferase